MIALVYSKYFKINNLTFAFARCRDGRAVVTINGYIIFDMENNEITQNGSDLIDGFTIRYTPASAIRKNAVEFRPVHPKNNKLIGWMITLMIKAWEKENDVRSKSFWIHFKDFIL